MSALPMIRHSHEILLAEKKHWVSHAHELDPFDYAHGHATHAGGMVRVEAIRLDSARRKITAALTK